MAAIAKRHVCPECGGKTEIFENIRKESKKYNVYCAECGFEDVRIIGDRWDNKKCVAIEYETKTAAVKAWNDLCASFEEASN